jgi:peptidoglycan/LPS O-acetylase OafA/YrhL
LAWIGLPVAIFLLGSIALLFQRGQSDPVIWLFAYPLTGIATASALVISLTEGPVARVLSTSSLRWCGKYSFGLYVWHPIVNMLFLHSTIAIVHVESGEVHIIAAFFFIFLLNFAVAWVSYNYWEKPFLHLKRFFSSKASAAGSLGGPLSFGSA